MTNDERFVLRTNILHYEAMLELNIEDERRLIIENLLAEAKDVLEQDRNRH